MSMSHSAQTLTLHIWPSKWDLPSIEPSCIAAAFYLQLALPGRFSIQECTDPDASPSGRSVSAEVVLPCTLKRFFFFIGQLPYLSHGHHTVAPLSSIVKYVAALTPATVPPVTEDDGPEPAFSADVDALLSTTERARRIAWIAHVESALGDLVVRCRLPEFHIVVIHNFYRPMRSIAFLQTTSASCIPRYLLSTKFRNLITCLVASARCIRFALRPMECGPLRKRVRLKSRSFLARRSQRRMTQSRYLRTHSSASGWVTQIVLQASFGLTVIGLGKVTRSI